MRPLRGAVVQSLNVRQTRLRCSLPVGQHVGGSSGYDSTMRPRPTKSIQPFAHHRLRDVRQIVLQVRVAGADQRQVGHRRFALARGVDLPHDADQRILRRLVAVAGRKDRRPLDVRIVVGAAAA